MFEINSITHVLLLSLPPLQLKTLFLKFSFTSLMLSVTSHSWLKCYWNKTLIKVPLMFHESNNVTSESHLKEPRHKCLQYFGELYTLTARAFCLECAHLKPQRIWFEHSWAQWANCKRCHCCMCVTVSSVGFWQGKKWLSGKLKNKSGCFFEILNAFPLKMYLYFPWCDVHWDNVVLSTRYSVLITV